MAYPTERCLMEVTQQRAKVERRKRSELSRGMATGLLFDPTFKNPPLVSQLVRADVHKHHHPPALYMDTWALPTL
ncbi:unnamed protein product [Gulo gulo]|uniref:Uncharacterized protein n=1 Tax=Gulo gulo TaxID=48420 RepID=A0A9X9PX40_GULGU|nr:unnamed protein product [Gulo gulo]